MRMEEKMKKRVKKFLIKLLAIVCSAMLLFLSPCARYLDASSIQTVYASDWAIVVGGGVAVDAVLKFLIGLLGSVALKEAYEQYEEEINQSFYDYISAPGRFADLVGEKAKDTCVKIYDKASNTIQEISWEDMMEGLSQSHDVVVDDLTDLYAQYCPALLETFEDFVTDILDGDVYIDVISNAIVEYENISEEDIVAQNSGNLYTYNWSILNKYTSYKFGNCSEYHTYTKPYSYRAAGYTEYSSSVLSDGTVRYSVDSYVKSRGNYSITGFGYCVITRNDGMSTVASRATGLNWYDSYNQRNEGYINGSQTLSANFPIFSDKEAAENYIRTGEGYEDALNYGSSIYDDIESNVDIPPFHKGWQQEFWERLTNTPDVIGIGSYGHGVSEDNWGDDIPWIGLESLQEYSRSLLDIYNQIINDILNGTYDSSEDIPGTYSEAWEKAISEAWDNVEQSTDAVPGESEKDKPTDGDDEEKEDPEGGGGDSGDANNEDNNDQKEPPEGEDDEIIDPNKLEHIFGNEQHNLGDFLNSFNGDRTAAYIALLNATQEYIQTNDITGTFMNIVVEVNGFFITVRGTVVDGIVKIGTAFIP